MNEELKRLAGLVNRPEWDMFLVYLNNKCLDECRALEVCTQDALKGIQGKVSVYRALLTLRDDVNKLVSAR